MTVNNNNTFLSIGLKYGTSSTNYIDTKDEM